MTPGPTVVLNDGHHIPRLGYGTYQVPPAQTAEVVREALEAGYRHIDTAQMYGNEHGVGEGVRDSGLKRQEVYVTSKLSNAFHRPDDARRAMDQSLTALGFDYLDLFLIHWPLPTLPDRDYVATWRTMEEFKRDGRARSIGVSNFTRAHLERLAAETDTVPAVNQIEAHPFFPNDELRAYGADRGIATEAWSPLAQGAALENPVVLDLARRLERTPAQVIVRWHLERGDIVFPKSMAPARMRENLEVLGFELGPGPSAALAGLDRGSAGRIGPDPDTFDWVPD